MAIEITKENLISDIQVKIRYIENKIGNSYSNEVSDATNRVAISNLYIALSNLITT